MHMHKVLFMNNTTEAERLVLYNKNCCSSLLSTTSLSLCCWKQSSPLETEYQPAIIENITKHQSTSKTEWRRLEKEDHGLSPSPEASSSVFDDTVSFQGREDKK